MMTSKQQDDIEIPPRWSSTFLNNRSLVEARIFFKADKSLVTEFTPLAPVEGPAAHSHGGFLATILDETMGSTCWYNGLPVLAANLQVRYRKSVPLLGTYLCQAKIKRLETRRAYVEAKIIRDDKIFCQATGLFIRVPLELLKNQPDMAKMVQVIQTIKDGRSLQELIDQDNQQLGQWQSHDLGNLMHRGEQLLKDFLEFGQKAISRGFPKI